MTSIRDPRSKKEARGITLDNAARNLARQMGYYTSTIHVQGGAVVGEVSKGNPLRSGMLCRSDRFGIHVICTVLYSEG